MPDRLERLTNLVANLLATRRPLLLEEIVEMVPDYPDDKLSYRRQFERDKETLRGIGIPIAVEPIDPLSNEAGYRIRPEDYYLTDLELTADEQAALHVAVSAVRLEGGEGREALWKLGGTLPESVPLVVALPTMPALEVLFDAYRRRITVSFLHRGDPRRLDPYGLVFRRGRWYVVGHDHDRDAPRAFRVDRIVDVELVADTSFQPPAGLDPTSLLRDQPLLFENGELVDADVLVDRSHAAPVITELGEESVQEHRDDGSIVVRLPVANRDAFRSWLAGLLDHAEVIAPSDLRSDVISWLEAVAGSAQ